MENKGLKGAIKYIIFNSLAKNETEIAEIVKTSKGNLSSFKSGAKPTPQRIADEMQKIFGISSDYIMGASDEMLINPKDFNLSRQEKANSFFLAEIASLKAQIKGSLATDELRELKQTFDNI